MTKTSPRHLFSTRFLAFGLVALTLATSAGAASVAVSRFWHNHQPIYWPGWSSYFPGSVQYAAESIDKKGTQGGHPDNDLNEIFSKYDRLKAYTYGPVSSLGNCPDDAGYAISYSGSLIQNVRSLGQAGKCGYGADWNSSLANARTWRTSRGGPRMDLVGFCFHHALAPVLPKAVFRKEIETFKQVWWKAWGGDMNLTDHSKGFFPTEMAFSEEMIDVLVEQGYEWVIVASHHLSRTCPTYFNNGTPADNYSIFSSEPNKADLLGPSPTTGWWFNSPNPGNCAWNVSPFAYQLHTVQYINPYTGAKKEMIAVPSDDVLSYKAGYSGAEIGMVSDNIAPYANDPAHPALVLPSTDGDNAWGGGDSSWMESAPAFFRNAKNNGYMSYGIQDFVNDYGKNATLAHVEDGAWIFPEMDYGSPYFLKWVDPPCNVANIDKCYPGTQVDLETPGFALKFWDWAPIIAAANWCETAEQVARGEGTPVEAWRIACPYDFDNSNNHANPVEQAWNIFLAGLDSGFNYYGGKGNDDECKPPLANANSINCLKDNGYTSSRLSAADQTPPSIFRPQRFPYNPGGYTFGWFNTTPTDSRYRKKMGSDFYVWTHAYDVSGIPDGGVILHVRKDKDGVNPLNSIQNETYAGGNEVEEWIDIPMTKRVLPRTTAELNAAANAGDINYEFEPAENADYYFAKVDMFRGALVDYYIEARDTRGNTYKSDIQHVWVEDDGTAPGAGGTASARASFEPAAPSDEQDITVTFYPNDGALSNATSVICLYTFAGKDEGWANVAMTKSASTNTWSVTFKHGEGAYVDNAPALWVCFHDAAEENWESNGGSNWKVSITDADAPTDGVKISPNPAVAGQPVTVTYYASGRALASASAINCHHGYNGANWTEVPGDAMTQAGATWSLTFNVPSVAETLSMCFNDGSTWDNNGGADWQFPVTGTVTPPVTETVELSELGPQPNALLGIVYNPAGRPLAAASSVYMHYGFSDAKGQSQWTTVPGDRMTAAEGLWSLEVQPPPGSVSMRLCFNDTATWDNNDTADWTFDLSTNYPAVPDGLAISDPAADQTSTREAVYRITGTAGSDIVGPIAWSNAATAETGSFESLSVWSRTIPLASGSNTITFSGQSASYSAPSKQDDASNYTLNTNYTGLNTGTGFQPWRTIIPPESIDDDNDNPDEDLAFVVLSPGPKQGCTSTVKFYANNEASALAHGTVENVFVYWGATDADNFTSWTTSDHGDQMTWVDADGAWEAQLVVPANAVSLSFLFNDGGDKWLHYKDVKGGDQENWICEVTPSASGPNGGIWAQPGTGFGMWENFGQLTAIYRPFGRDLAANDVFSFTFKNGDIASATNGIQPGVGAGVCSIGATTNNDVGFRFYFNGGQEHYLTPQGDTGIGWTTDPITVTLVMADSTNYTATFAINGAVQSTLTGSFDEPCNAFRAWSWANKASVEGNNYDVFVDQLSVASILFTDVSAKTTIVYDTGETKIVHCVAANVAITIVPDTSLVKLTASIEDDEGNAIPDGTKIPVYMANELVDRKWQWNLLNVVPVTGGTITISVPDDNSLCLLTLGIPPNLAE